ncbi:hypothetical protein F4561_006136 [Lipingzhangella halophila]|uniref:Asp23/Gls24 family envelope stress response protein n=1 Tax=Lipingzhangella halophila TaxID=1783352 RepID=A0A7W7RP10_9ACTN|nr:hypothetical protein [Lipingzhangella halophila]MBB4935242.1 hypothetical protein [Lipingzhangella halophila]
MRGDVASEGRRIADTVSGLPDIEGLSSGSLGTVCTPVPGGRIEGVALRDDSVQVGVVVRLGRPLPEIAADVHDAVLAMVPGRRVHVSIEDVAPDPAGTVTPPVR